MAIIKHVYLKILVEGKTYMMGVISKYFFLRDNVGKADIFYVR